MRISVTCGCARARARDTNDNLMRIFLQKKIMNFESDYNTLETKYEQLDKEHERLREHTRKVEQKNDDLERSNRVVSATVSDLETMLNQAYEKNEFLELEVEDKESLSEKHQRVLDELRGERMCECEMAQDQSIHFSIAVSDLKQEMKVKTPSSNSAQPPTLREYSQMAHLVDCRWKYSTNGCLMAAD